MRRCDVGVLYDYFVVLCGGGSEEAILGHNEVGILPQEREVRGSEISGETGESARGREVRGER